MTIPADIPEDIMRAADEALSQCQVIGTTDRPTWLLSYAHAILAERERCAQIAEGSARAFPETGTRRDYAHGYNSARLAIAAAIREGEAA